MSHPKRSRSIHQNIRNKLKTIKFVRSESKTVRSTVTDEKSRNSRNKSDTMLESKQDLGFTGKQNPRCVELEILTVDFARARIGRRRLQYESGFGSRRALFFFFFFFFVGWGFEGDGVSERAMGDDPVRRSGPGLLFFFSFFLFCHWCFANEGPFLSASLFYRVEEGSLVIL